MSERAHAKTQAQQETLMRPSPSNSLLQRTCACGQHTIGGVECPTCRSEQSSLSRSQTALSQPSATTQENVASANVSSNEASHFDYDFSQIPLSSAPTLPLLINAVQHAATDESRSLDESVRGPLEQSLGHNFSQVRIHSGSASSWSAERLGARAYTLGNDIYLGQEAHQLGRPQYNRLLAHEAIHTVQQGGRPVAPQAKLEVSSPTDAAEVEADHLAESIISNAERPASRSLSLRDSLRVSPVTPSTVSQVAVPLIQRDLTKPLTAIDGTITPDLKTISNPGGENGMYGTITFHASDTAPDSKSIRLLQIAKVEDLTTKKDLVWGSDEANRQKVMTVEDKSKGTEGGYFVDVLHKNRSPRGKKADSPVSPYYIDDYTALKNKNMKDGSKKGKTVQDASLQDYPHSTGNVRFSFETAAKDSDKGYIYATMKWGFTISDASKGIVDNEYESVHNVSSRTFDAAATKFDEFYRNPGASTAPSK